MQTAGLPTAVFDRSAGTLGGQSMELLADLAAWSLVVSALLLFVCQLLSYKLGFQLGIRGTVWSKHQADGVALIVNVLFALLAFTLALTVSYSSARFAERRAGVLAEANAIGTAWLRAGAIDHPGGDEIAKLLDRYTHLRREYILAPRSSPAIGDIDQRSSSLQTEIWNHLSIVVRERSDPVAVSLMTALNETFDASTAERFALVTRFPPQLFWLLIGMALISMTAFGYQLGLKGHRMHTLVALLTAVWTAVIIVILDLNAPRLGTMRTSVSVYDWTLQGMTAGQPTALRHDQNKQ